jgi:Permeases
MDKLFKLKENNTTVRTEVIGGLTTFFAMAYIIFVNPNILSMAIGEEYWSSIMVATCLSAAIGTLLTAFLANVPFAQAPGMGLNAFFTYTVCFGMGYTWQQALSIVLISGILFLIITLTPLRVVIVNGIPSSLKSAIGGGIGLFIAFIGLLGSEIIRLDAAANITALNLSSGGKINSNAMLAIIGLVIIAALMVWKVKGAIFFGIIATTAIGFLFGITTLPESATMGAIQLATFWQFDFSGLMVNGLLPLITAVISFAIVDMFDTIGTLVGTAAGAGMLDEDGNLPRGDKALIADAIATCAGACLGTSTVTTYVESSSGISEGARTGLSSVVVSILFLFSIFLAPIAGIVPSAATAPALIIVGVLMLKGSIKSIEWENLEIAIPCFLTIAMMPFAYSISDGIAFGFIFYTLIKLICGKGKEVPALMYVLSIVFMLMYVLKIIVI